jgi:Ca-activated chloride channel family protein
VVLKGLPRAWTIYVSKSLPAIFGFGLVFLIVALARPQRGLAEHRVKSEGIDIVMLIDLSTSMEATDLSTASKRRDRLDAAKEVMEPFIKERINDRIAMVGFAAVPYSVAPLTLDHGWLIQRMEMLKTGMLEDGTAIGSAIASGANRLRDSKAKSRVMVLLTDGVNNRGKISPEDAARIAKTLNIKIYTVGVGSNDGWIRNPGGGIFGAQRMLVELDEESLKNIAEITGGLYFRATDMKELKQIYAKIDKMEKTEIEMKNYTRYEEAFMPFLFWGVGLLLIERLLAFSKFGRLP